MESGSEVKGAFRAMGWKMERNEEEEEGGGGGRNGAPR